MPKLFIFGLGYSAKRIAQRAQSLGWEVVATGSEGKLSFDDTDAVRAELSWADAVLSSVPPDRESESDPVLERYGAALGHAWIGYISSTGVYGDRQGAWRLDPGPLVIDAPTWTPLEKGLAQRAELFNALLVDLYGEQRLLAEGDQPWSVLRAGQFHEFAEQALGFVPLGPVSLVPVMRSQPVAAREVAESLVDLAASGPAGRVADLAGPEEHRVDRMARELCRARGLRRSVVPLRLPGAAGRAMRDGSLTAAGDPTAVLGRTTFAEWLAAGGRAG